jgi:hypothetical protein
MGSRDGEAASKGNLASGHISSRGRKTQAPKSRIRGEDGNTQSQEERVVSDNTDNNNTQDAWRHDATDS